MMKYKTFCYPENVIEILDELENKGVLSQHIHITEYKMVFSPFSIKINQQEQIYKIIAMKEKILKEIDSFVNMCYTMFKIGAGDFAKENFPRLVENFYDENRSDEENYKAIKDMFELNIVFNQKTNEEVAKTIQIFLEGWYDKIKI